MSCTRAKNLTASASSFKVKLSALLGYDRPTSREPERIKVTRMSVRRTLPDGATEAVELEAVELVQAEPE